MVSYTTYYRTESQQDNDDTYNEHSQQCNCRIHYEKDHFRSFIVVCVERIKCHFHVSATLRTLRPVDGVVDDDVGDDVSICRILLVRRVAVAIQRIRFVPTENKLRRKLDFLLTQRKHFNFVPELFERMRRPAIQLNLTVVVCVV